MTTNSKRWVVFSVNTFNKTGTIKAINACATRDAARSAKRAGKGNFAIYDSVNNMIVR